MEFLNSPLFVLLFLVFWIALLWWYRRSGRTSKCANCGKGVLQEMEARPEGLVDTNTSATVSSTAVMMRVKYKCPVCKAEEVRSETRRK